jgi:signal transduction histidine kinase
MLKNSYKLSAPPWVLILLCVSAVLWCNGCHQKPTEYPGYPLKSNSLDDWQSYGGTWDVSNGVIHNHSDERGAKLLTGSGRWTNYRLQADVRFDGDHGDMGVILRSSREEEGVDAYDGYYVGLRTTDDTLIIGRSDYGWQEARPVPMPGGVHADTWYRLIVIAQGCKIGATSENLTTGAKTGLVFSEQPCRTSGRVGLRSLGTGGSWRNIEVAPSGLQDFEQLTAHAAGIEKPEFPKREADYNSFFRFSASHDIASRNLGSYEMRTSPQPRIGDLQQMPRDTPTHATVRGVVTITSPQLYIQDATGGVRVEDSPGLAANVGDTVEVSGSVQPTLYSAVFKDDTVRLLWSGQPVPPISITSSQAASGSYDARFIEVQGHLSNVVTDTAGHVELNIREDGQDFKAILGNTPKRYLRELQPGSYLRLRGVCVLDRQYTQAMTAFALLLRSEDDVQVLAGPPWWTPLHMTLLFVGLLVLALLIQVIYFRIQRWKTLAITQERERLAQDIHDTMAQSFAGVGYQIQGIRSSIVHGTHNGPHEVADKLDVAYQLVRRCHEEASRTVAMFGASLEGSGGLVDELENTVIRISDEQVKAVALIQGISQPLSLRLTKTLLHIGQEAITNSLRHAAPEQIRIVLGFERNELYLTIADNGCGFDVPRVKPHFGMQGMRQKARELGGQLAITSKAGSGTEVTVRVPLQQKRPAVRMRLRNAITTMFSRHIAK